ncbi:hypothetical protein BYT27DRAFT_7264191 [Phlegmacium glaucopus]|nr:hypothetical protein BYT27DRAFT_7264191 [Phlegmacium glaucopus]
MCTAFSTGLYERFQRPFQALYRDLIVSFHSNAPGLQIHAFDFNQVQLRVDSNYIEFVRIGTASVYFSMEAGRPLPVFPEVDSTKRVQDLLLLHDPRLSHLKAQLINLFCPAHLTSNENRDDPFLRDRGHHFARLLGWANPAQLHQTMLETSVLGVNVTSAVSVFINFNPGQGVRFHQGPNPVTRR